MARHDIEIWGFDRDGVVVRGYGVGAHVRNPAWTPRIIKKMLAREGAVRFERTRVPAQISRDNIRGPITKR